MFILGAVAQVDAICVCLVKQSKLVITRSTSDDEP